MKITKKYEFPQEVDNIYKYYTSAALIKAKMEALGARNVDIRIEKEGDTVRVEITREVPAEVPGPLKKFAQPWNKVVQRETWTGTSGGPYRAKMEIEIHNVPVRVNGEMKLVATEEGSASASITEIKSGIPFFGKLLADFMAEASENAIDEEMNYIREHA